VNYAESRGVVISQPLSIAKQAIESGWVKGAKRIKIREAAFDEMKAAVGQQVDRLVGIRDRR
jgi:hypothetical protein